MCRLRLSLLPLVVLLLAGNSRALPDEDCSEWEDAGEEELIAATKELQEGRLSADGLALFRCNAQLKEGPLVPEAHPAAPSLPCSRPGRPSLPCLHPPSLSPSCRRQTTGEPTGC